MLNINWRGLNANKCICIYLWISTKFVYVSAYLQNWIYIVEKKNDYSCDSEIHLSKTQHYVSLMGHQMKTVTILIIIINLLTSYVSQIFISFILKHKTDKNVYSFNICQQKICDGWLVGFMVYQFL